jgi:hypothetical protein
MRQTFGKSQVSIMPATNYTLVFAAKIGSSVNMTKVAKGSLVPIYFTC